VKIDRTNVFDLVYQVVRLIPRGKITSYGAIAKCIGLKSGARMVGHAMSAAHQVPDLPAHRVVNSQGLLTGKHHFGSPNQMQRLLEEEGLVIKNDKVLHFKEHFWDPATAMGL
jgi:methylated-DNA-protein-cysteine methyltransferase-like protein